MSRRVHVAVFTSEKRLMDAVRTCREHGMSVLDVRSPYPIHGLDDIAGIPRSRLPAACLIGGIIGLSLALWFQYWTSSVDWPIDVGGKPWNSLPAFAPVAFELTVLFAGLATVGGLILRRNVRPGRQPTFTELGVTDDRFALVVTRTDANVTDAGLAELWRYSGAERTLEYVDEGAR